MLRIRVRMDPHQIERKDPDPDLNRIIVISWIWNPDPHDSDKLDPDPHQFADDKPKCMEYEPI